MGQVYSYSMLVFFFLKKTNKYFFKVIVLNELMLSAAYSLQT